MFAPIMEEPSAADPGALIAEIGEFIKEQGIAETTFGFRAVNDGKVLDRVRAGNVTLNTVKRIRNYMAGERAKRAAAA